ncbi:hypothetical protein D9619_004794 [Psilocybe cf. subviscida]|uniref:Cytochrome P450 n=1 Tax=Psilocybe cf. subviscida TaxID=2480587 RepID=A0A8H5F8P8_9AGAR|nr:hypothetical protein D9619_004794 [Psilocybe cf. subviscida]
MIVNFIVANMSWLSLSDSQPLARLLSLMSSNSFLKASICALVLSGIVARFKWVRFRNIPFPPGPPATSWLSGHFSILPQKHPWKGYTEWAKTYGPVIYFRAFHQRTIVLSSYEDCAELLDKRSTLYSDRPVIPMVEILGWDFAAAVMPYGARWRRQRRLFQKMFKKDMSLTYRSDQTRKVNDMLLALLDEPSGFRDHIKAVTAATIMSITYDYDIKAKADPFVHLVDSAVDVLSKAFLPGAAIVNVFPILRFLPSWLPGTGFKKDIVEGRELTSRMKEIPFRYVQDNIESGTALRSLVGDGLKTCKTHAEVQDLRDFAPMTYAAGAETTTAALETFFLVMATNPDVQKKAQQEIDACVGDDRLPSYDDWSSLPYIEAIVREILRWRTVLPLSLPHCATEDDIYKGYFIPKGTMILANVWALTRDETRYKDPEAFRPDRFIDENGDLIEDDVDYVFGFGRRTCPGRHMARASVFLAAARILSTFNIGFAKDKLGKDIPISDEYTTGVLSHPIEHACSITERSDKAKRLIKEAVAQTKHRK